jgi:hypothetical protein
MIILLGSTIFEVYIDVMCQWGKGKWEMDINQWSHNFSADKNSLGNDFWA